MKQILIVEDVELNRDLLIQLLEDHYDLVIATDGAEGLTLAEQQNPDLILLDLSLPVINGWEVARRLKSDSRLQSIPILALSSHAMHGDEEQALQCGCDDYLSKPLDEDRLFAKIEQLTHSESVI